MRSDTPSTAAADEGVGRGLPGFLTQALLAEYGVDYVVVGPYEVNDFGANAQFWAAMADPVYDFGGYAVYATVQP